MNLVVGEISYTNILPMYYYIDRVKLDQLGCTFVHKIPSSLNKEMALGKIDVGGISSFAYGENADKYTLLPNLSVSANKAVGSIFLFSKKPLEQLNGASIALTSSSATSIHLLKIILQHFYKYDNHFEVMRPSFKEMMDKHDACLLIGDDAILTSWQEESEVYRYDLAELWNKHTGLSMTFAVFAVRNDVFKSNKKTLNYLYEQLLESKSKSKKFSYEPMINDIRRNLGGSFNFWYEYFQGLCYDLGERQLEGLKYYFQLAHEYGYIKNKVNTIVLWNEAYEFHSI